MINLLRIVVSGFWLYLIAKAAENARVDLPGGDLTNAYYLAGVLIVGLLMGALWTPYIAEGLCGNLTNTFTEGAVELPERPLRRFRERAQKKGNRRTLVFACVLEAIFHPNLPSGYLIGMRNAKRGSWLEKMFAREVYRFDNQQNCVEAKEVLQRHGLGVGRHWSEEINLGILAGRKRNRPAPPTLSLPQVSHTLNSRRNPKIQLFRGADPKPAIRSPKGAPPPPTGPHGTKRILAISRTDPK